jgi:hypothetical protein
VSVRQAATARGAPTITPSCNILGCMLPVQQPCMFESCMSAESYLPVVGMGVAIQARVPPEYGG